MRLEQLFAQRSLAALVVNVFGLGAVFVMQVFITRYLGADNYGVYVYVVSWCTMLAMIAKLGLDNATLRYFSVYNSMSSYGLMRGFLRRRDQVGFLVSISLTLCVIGYVLVLHDKIDQNLAEAFLIGAFLIPILCLLVLSESTLRALMFTVSAQIPSQLIRPLLTIFILLVIGLVFKVDMTGVIAVMSFLAASVVVLLVSIILVRYRLPSEINKFNPLYKTKEWMFSSFGLMVMSFMMMLLNELDILMIGWLLNTTEAGIYAVAIRLSTLVLFGLNAVNVIIGPIIARLHNSDKTPELARMINLTGVALFVFSVPMSLVLVVFGDIILGIFGSEFVVADNVLVILVIAQLVNALSGSVGYLMTMTGHTSQAAIAVGFGLIGHVVLNLILIPLYGIEGAAFSMALSTIFWNLMLAFLVWYYLKINTWSYIMSPFDSIKQFRG